MNKVQNVVDQKFNLSFVRYMPFFAERFDHINDKVLIGPPDWFPLNIFVHRWCYGELPVFHTHPTWSISIVLKGGYFEVYNDGKMRIRKAWNIWFRRAYADHYIKIPEELGNRVTESEYRHDEIRKQETVTIYIRPRFLKGTKQSYTHSETGEVEKYGDNWKNYEEKS